MNRPNSDTLRQSHRAGVGFLIAEVDTGLSFMSIAESASPNDGRDRHLRNAREAYFIVTRLLSRVVFEPDEKLKLELKMTELRRRLLAAGCSLDPPS